MTMSSGAASDEPSKLDGGPRSRTRSSADLASLAAAAGPAFGGGSLDAESEEDLLGVASGPLGLPLRRHAAVGAVGLWLLAVAAAAAAVVAARQEVDGHMPPFLIPADAPALAATTCLLALLLLPWALLTWRQLRAPRSRWKLLDACAVVSLWLSGAAGALCLLAVREQPTSAALVVGTTVFSLACLSMVVLPAVRAGTALAAAVTESAWKWEPNLSRVALAAVAMLALCSGFRAPTLQRVELHVAGLPADADGYTLCMLSDLHAGPTIGAGALREIAKQAGRLQCQAVLFNGDMAEGTVEEREEEMKELLPLAAAAPDGAYFVPGNHEFYNFEAPGGAGFAAHRWARWWEAHGVRLLNNSQVQLPLSVPGGWFALAGVDDPLGHPDLASALAGGPGRGLPVVLAAHRPLPYVHEAARLGVAVQLSGHTHGGQMWPVHLPAGQQNEGFLSGLYHVNTTELYVSDGTVGSYMTRLRLLSQAEITEVVLRAQPCPGPAWRQASLGVPLAWCWLGLLGASAALSLGRTALVAGGCSPRLGGGRRVGVRSVQLPGEP